MTTPTLPYSGPTAEDLARIPAALKDCDQWILWQGADRIDPDTGEILGLNKIPINPQTLRKADTTDPRTWGTFDQCVAAFPVALEEWEHDNPSAYRGGGIGFVFAQDDPYVGIDLDHCRDPDTGALAAWAEEHIDRLASYTEASPSGTGVLGTVWLLGSMSGRSLHPIMQVAGAVAILENLLLPATAYLRFPAPYDPTLAPRSWRV
jgi:hypothetical protein